MAILPMQMGRTKMSRVKKKTTKTVLKQNQKTQNISYIFSYLNNEFVLASQHFSAAQTTHDLIGKVWKRT